MKELTMEAIKNNWKRYTLSTVVTFLTGFSMVLVQEIDNLTIEALRTGGLLGLLFAGFRAGIKAVAEVFVRETGDK